jgi:hypothetical protein
VAGARIGAAMAGFFFCVFGKPLVSGGITNRD